MKENKDYQNFLIFLLFAGFLGLIAFSVEKSSNSYYVKGYFEGQYDVLRLTNSKLTNQEIKEQLQAKRDSLYKTINK